MEFQRDVSIEIIKSERKALLQRAEAELLLVAPHIREICCRIIQEKPATTIFMDKGARLFASPMQRWIYQQTRQSQDFAFYNDRSINYVLSLHPDFTEFFSRYPKHILNRIHRAHQDNKSIFFIDETFSGGNGLYRLSKGLSLLGFEDYHYFAISRERDPTKIKRVNDSKIGLEKLLQDSRVTIFPTTLGTLFSKAASALYVEDDPATSATKRLFRPSSDEDPYGNYPFYADRNSRFIPDEGSSWSSYDSQVQKINYQTLQELKRLIFSSIQ